MANKSLFASLKSRFVRADTRNEAGGRAYTLAPKHALAQLAATGCFNGTYYAQADEQLATLKTLVDQVADNAFLAKLAVYSRQRAMMKDMPVALLLALSKRDPALFRKVFDRVVDNGRTLRTLVQFVRSGQFGRKGLSYSLQREVFDVSRRSGHRKQRRDLREPHRPRNRLQDDSESQRAERLLLELLHRLHPSLRLCGPGPLLFQERAMYLGVVRVFDRNTTARLPSV